MGARRSMKQSIREIETLDKRIGTDPVQRWEGYRDQAYLWRALAVLQVPATVLGTALVFAMYYFADTVVEVPSKPEPGYYTVADISDREFVRSALNVANLISSYQPNTAEAQFKRARESLWEPALSQFNKEFINYELPIIKDTMRVQLFYLSNRQIKIERHDDAEYVEVRLPGTRQKLIGKQTVAPDEVAWFIRLTTVPGNEINKYGIVATNIILREVALKQLKLEDYRARQEEKKAKRAAKTGQQ